MCSVVCQFFLGSVHDLMFYLKHINEIPEILIANTILVESRMTNVWKHFLYL